MGSFAVMYRASLPGRRRNLARCNAKWYIGAEKKGEFAEEPAEKWQLGGLRGPRIFRTRTGLAAYEV